MYDFTRTRPFDEQQIETLRQRLTRMDRAALIRFYNSTLHMCMLTREKPPRAPYLQQLVQAWKEMVQRGRSLPASDRTPVYWPPCLASIGSSCRNERRPPRQRKPTTRSRPPCPYSGPEIRSETGTG